MIAFVVIMSTITLCLIAVCVALSNAAYYRRERDEAWLAYGRVSADLRSVCKELQRADDQNEHWERDFDKVKKQRDFQQKIVADVITAIEQDYTP